MNTKKKVLVLVLICILIFSGFVGFKRYSVERKNNKAQILINYTDIKTFAQIQNREVEDVAKEFKSLGVTGVIFKELTLCTSILGSKTGLDELEEIAVYDSIELKMKYRDIASLNELENIIPNHRYAYISNENTRNMVYENLKHKIFNTNIIELEGYEFIDIGTTYDAMYSTGIGYIIDDLKSIASVGLTVSPQIRDFTYMSEEALKYVVDENKDLPNLGTIFFNDNTVPGYNMPYMIEFAKEHSIGSIEFVNQKGLQSLINKASDGGKDYNTIRLFTISNAETKKLSISDMLDKYTLAVRERNIRSILVKMPNTGEENKDYEDGKFLINKIISSLEKDGFTISSEPYKFNFEETSNISTWIIGISPLILLLIIFMHIDKERLGIIFAIIIGICFTALLFIRPILAKQAMALLGAILYPTYSVFIMIKENKRTILETIRDFLIMCIISFGGVITIVGLLNNTSFAYAMDLFKGVKLAHIAPIIIIAVLIEFKNHGIDKDRIKKLLFSNVTYISIAIIGILFIVLSIYASRTGNDGTVSSLELTIRSYLTNILGVRPRTKEFLIGHPLMIVILYYGYKERYIPFLIGGLIGQISLVNTYAHIHTPLIISLNRSFNGIIIGIVLGVIGIYVFKLLLHLGRRIV